MAARRRNLGRLLVSGLAVVVVGLAVFWLARLERTSPRLDVLRPHVRYQATLDEFRRAAAEHRFPLEPDSDCSWGTCFRVPLDGALEGYWLRLQFYSDGELQWAGLIRPSGEVAQCLFQVKK